MSPAFRPTRHPCPAWRSILRARVWRRRRTRYRRRCEHPGVRSLGSREKSPLTVPRRMRNAMRRGALRWGCALGHGDPRVWRAGRGALVPVPPGHQAGGHHVAGVQSRGRFAVRILRIRNGPHLSSRSQGCRVRCFCPHTSAGCAARLAADRAPACAARQGRATGRPVRSSRRSSFLPGVLNDMIEPARDFAHMRVPSFGQPTLCGFSKCVLA